jgi:hypothetical protein
VDYGKDRDVMMNKANTMLNLSSQIFCDRTYGDFMRRILVIDNGSLLDAGVAKYLVSMANLEVCRAIYTDEESLARDVVRMQPDVVVLFHDKALDREKFIALLDPLNLMNKLQIIMIYLSHNLISAYEDKCWVFATSEKFLPLIYGCSANPSYQT